MDCCGDDFKFYGSWYLTVTCWCLSRLRSTGVWIFWETTSGSVSAFSTFAWFDRGYTVMAVYGGVWDISHVFLREGGPRIPRCLRSVHRQAHGDSEEGFSPYFYSIFALRPLGRWLPTFWEPSTTNSCWLSRAREVAGSLTPSCSVTQSAAFIALSY